MSDTPRTDIMEAAAPADDAILSYSMMRGHARNIERESAARQHAISMRDIIIEQLKDKVISTKE